MSGLGMTLAAAADAFGWGAVFDYVANLAPGSSATWRALHREEAAYASDYHVALMLADVYDAIAALAYIVARVGGSKVAKPELYPRPGKNGKGNARRFGSGAIPIKEFDKWYYGGGD